MKTDSEKVARLLAAHERLVYLFRWQVRFGAAIVLAGLFLGFLAEGFTRVVLLAASCGLGLFTVAVGSYYQRRFKRSVARIQEAAAQRGLI